MSGAQFDERHTWTGHDEKTDAVVFRVGAEDASVARFVTPFDDDAVRQQLDRIVQLGGVIAWASAGSAGFKGTKKGTPFAAQITGDQAAKKAKEFGVRQVSVHVSGPGSGRETAIRALQAAGFSISQIRDVTPIPHNGCRPPKPRRV